MSLAIAKKQSFDTVHKKRYGCTHGNVNSLHTGHHTFPVPIIQRKPNCPCGGGCPRCAPIIQPKLRISQPNDIYEPEADRVAAQVMRIPENAVVSNHLSGVRKEAETVQRKPT